MNKIEINGDVNDPNIVPMYKMPQLSIGVIQSGDKYDGTIVMRTASFQNKEVINLSNPGENRCWIEGVCDMPVKLLPKARIIIEL